LFGVSSSVIHERFQRWTEMGIFEKLMKRMLEYYTRECGGVGGGWQAQRPECKARLRQQTDDVIARGVFKVPTMEVSDELFWGTAISLIWSCFWQAMIPLDPTEW
jgi:hypothetical protein